MLAAFIAIVLSIGAVSGSSDIKTTYDAGNGRHYFGHQAYLDDLAEQAEKSKNAPAAEKEEEEDEAPVIEN